MSNEIECKEKLKKELSVLYEMELNNYLMTRAIGRLDAEIRPLGIRKGFSRPEKKVIRLDIEGIQTGAFFGGVIGFVVGIATGCSNMDSLFDIGSLLGSLIGWMVLCVGGGTLIATLLESIERSRKEANAQEEYDSAVARYKALVRSDEERVTKENKYKQCLLETRSALVNKKRQSNLVLSEMYQAVGIDKDFRSLLIMGYMNDFIRLGISSHLEGVDGLYYLIRKEIRWDLFQTTLEEISAKLDTIISNQDAIYQQLTEMNGKCDKMIDSLERSISIGVQNGKRMDEICENTSVSAYNIERMRVENEYRHMIGLS